MVCLSAAHAFDYIALRTNPGLTSCKEFATVMDISLDNDHSSCNASYILPYRCMLGIINLLLPYPCMDIHAILILHSVYKSKQTSI